LVIVAPARLLWAAMGIIGHRCVNLHRLNRPQPENYLWSRARTFESCRSASLPWPFVIAQDDLLVGVAA
jgi:hypothetical protein